MAMSVNRRIERNLPHVMGPRDPEAMIRVRSTDPIRASGLVPRSKAGHMTASDLIRRNAENTRAGGGPSTHDVVSDGAEESAVWAVGINLAPMGLEPAMTWL